MELLEHTLTRASRSWSRKDGGENVLMLRREYQEAMRDEASATVAEITGRKVLAMMSTNHLDPDLAVELSIQAPAPVDAAPR